MQKSNLDESIILLEERQALSFSDDTWLFFGKIMATFDLKLSLAENGVNAMNRRNWQTIEPFFVIIWEDMHSENRRW